MDRLTKLLDPKLGVMRGIFVHVEPGKGGPDPDDKIIGITVAELKEIHNCLSEARMLIDNSRDHIMFFIGSSYSETGKDDEAFVDKLGEFLGIPKIDWRFFNS